MLYFRNIHKAEIFSEIDRRENLVLPLQLMRQIKKTVKREKFIAAKWHSIGKT